MVLLPLMPLAAIGIMFIDPVFWRIFLVIVIFDLSYAIVPLIRDRIETIDPINPYVYRSIR